MRILSGLKPTGRPHLGNWFGAIRQWIALQDKGEAFYFLADLHALNQVRDAAAMREYVLAAALDYLALGLDPAKCTLFAQSDVPEVSELQWILGSVTPMGLLQRAHAYKDATAKGKEADFGLFAYPVLMAADILLYRSDLVPVGKDQVQHVEITRDIAVKFNSTYSKTFDPATGEGGPLRLPEAMVMAETAIVPGTDGRKMSKSYDNGIELFAPEKAVKKAIMGIVTDSKPVEAPKDPATCNVYQILKLFLPPEERAKVEARYRMGGEGYGVFKQMLLERFLADFGPARERREALARDPERVRAVLRDGAARARTTAREVLDDVKRACGLS